MRHNPYFSRWFSAIFNCSDNNITHDDSHNPYFSRWFSAIPDKDGFFKTAYVTILILVDGFLQFNTPLGMVHKKTRHNPYFSRWFSAIM